MTEEQIKGWVKFQLGELAGVDVGDIESGWVEIYGEDEQGNEGSCEVEIPSIARQALELIDSLEQKVQGLSSGHDKV